MTIIQVRFNRLTEFKAIHHRHDYITHYQIHIIAIQHFQGFRPIDCRQYGIFFRQLADNKGSHIRIILHYQYCRAIVFFSPCSTSTGTSLTGSVPLCFRSQSNCHILNDRQCQAEGITIFFFPHSQRSLMQFGQ